MSKRRIVFLDRGSVPDWLEFTGLPEPHELILHAHTSREEVAERVRDADIVIVNKVPIGREALEQARHLGLIAMVATGTDNIDLTTCDRLGIVVSNARGYARHSVPEHTFTLILALRRSLLAFRQSVEAGRWQESGQFCYFDFPVRDLAGSTLGIIGRGVLGQAVAQIARGFGMQVQFAARRNAAGVAEGHTEFRQFLRTSDVISLHCPLTPETRGMLGQAEFALMERHPLLINTARGDLVDEQALEQALACGQISGAGFDVASQEPPAPDHPLMRLLAHPNFILTPHMAWSSREAVLALTQQLIANIEAYCRGEPRNVVKGRQSSTSGA